MNLLMKFFIKYLFLHILTTCVILAVEYLVLHLLTQITKINFTKFLFFLTKLCLFLDILTTYQFGSALVFHESSQILKKLRHISQCKLVVNIKKWVDINEYKYVCIKLVHACCELTICTNASVIENNVSKSIGIGNL